VKGRRLVDNAGQKAFAKGSKRHEADAEFFEDRQYLLFRLPPPKRILALKCGNGLNSMSSADRFNAGFGKPKMPDLPFFYEVLHGARDVLDGHIRIDAVLVE
jgi:hypothetical protein